VFFAIFNANDVLPIAGLAAKIINSHGLNQPVILSNFLYQDKVTFSFRLSGFSATL